MLTLPSGRDACATWGSITGRPSVSSRSSGQGRPCAGLAPRGPAGQHSRHSGESMRQQHGGFDQPQPTAARVCVARSFCPHLARWCSSAAGGAVAGVAGASRLPLLLTPAAPVPQPRGSGNHRHAADRNTCDRSCRQARGAAIGIRSAAAAAVACSVGCLGVCRGDGRGCAGGGGLGGGWRPRCRRRRERRLRLGGRGSGEGHDQAILQQRQEASSVPPCIEKGMPARFQAMAGSMGVQAQRSVHSRHSAAYLDRDDHSIAGRGQAHGGQRLFQCGTPAGTHHAAGRVLTNSKAMHTN